MSELQSSVSDVTINSVTLESSSFFGGAPYNLAPHIREINIYESLFSKLRKIFQRIAHCKSLSL